MNDKLKLIGIKTKQGIFVANYIGNENSWSQYAVLDRHKINGETPQKTFDNHWYLISSEPKTVTKSRYPERINYRFELVNPELASDLIPPILKRDEVTYLDEDDDLCWKKEYAHLKSLYQLMWDETAAFDEPLDFEYVEVIETEEITPHVGLNNPIYQTKYPSNSTTTVNKSNLQYQVIDKIRFPPIYYQTHCPVMLPSQQFYEIIRYHVKQNIDYSVAEITSDYDFCFTVKKKIFRDNPIEIKKEKLKANGRSYSPRKIITSMTNLAGSVDALNMTSAERRYEKYPILPDLYAINVTELQVKVDNILQKIMEFINTPFEFCPVCHGTGLKDTVKPLDLEKLIGE